MCLSAHAVVRQLEVEHELSADPPVAALTGAKKSNMNQPHLRTCSHGLTYDADAQVGCVICRREGGLVGSEPAPSASGGTGRWVKLGIAVAALAALIGVASSFVGGESSDDRARPRSVRGRGSAAATEVTNEVAVSPPDPAPMQDLRRESERRMADERRAAEREARALARARRRVSITIYTTSWCGYCTRAKAYMDREGIRYTERDVEASPTARMTRDRLNPERSVPTFDIDGEAHVGFSPGGLEANIERAARRRL